MSISVICDHCGHKAPYGSATESGWILLALDREHHHFCTMDCVLFWGAGQERTTA
jgi:hypothetical protein